MAKLELMLFIVAASSLLAVDGCPFLEQPASKNISQGSTATFTVTTCGESMLWACNQVVYSNGYDQLGISVNETLLADGNLISAFTITTSGDMRFNGSEIRATIRATGVASDNVILQIQGLLGPVTDVNYNITSNVLSWSPPPTLDGVPIHYYIITIISNTSHPPSLNATTNMISLDGVDFTSCEDYIISIYPVNSVGNGTAMTLPYKHVGVPMVMNDNIDVLVNNSIISVIIDYKIQYNCSDQFPDSVYAAIREENMPLYVIYHNDIITTNTSGSGTPYNGRYVIIGLSYNSHFTGQLVFITESGLAVKTDMFTFDTYDISDVTISTGNGIGVCVNVSYISGSMAKGFIITINDTLLSYNVSRDSNGQSSYCITSLSDGYYLLRVYEWEDDGSVSDHWRIQEVVHITSQTTTTTSSSSDDVTSTVTITSPTPTVTDPAGTTIGFTVVGVILGLILAVVILVLLLLFKRRRNRNNNVAIDNAVIDDVPIDDVAVLRGVCRLSQDGAAAQDGDNNDKSDTSTGQPEELVRHTPANKTYEMVEYPTNPTLSTYINPDDDMSPQKPTPDTSGVFLVPAAPKLPPGIDRIRPLSTQVPPLYAHMDHLQKINSLPAAIDTVVYCEIGHINVSPKVVVHDGGRTEEGDDNDDATKQRGDYADLPAIYMSSQQETVH